MTIRTGTRVTLATVAMLALAACGGARVVHPSTWHAPWHRKAPPAPPAAVSVLDVHAAEGATAPVLPQRWDRNTLVIDLRALAGEGTLEIAPRAGKIWPMRMGLLVKPGSFGTLEVLGAERQQYVVPASGDDLFYALPPEAYVPEQKTLKFVWRAAATAP